MGVKGIGKKTAVPLLKEFGTIENLYANIENLNSSDEKQLRKFFKELGIKRSLLSFLLKVSDDPNQIIGKKAAFLSKKLAKINIDINELENVSLDSLKLEINQSKMQKKFLELEFKSLIK